MLTMTEHSSAIATMFPQGVSEAPKIITDLGGSLLLDANAEPDEKLPWNRSSLFPGDEFWFSRAHGEFMKTWQSFGVELYALSGWGSTAMTLFKRLYGIEVDYLLEHNAAEFGFGDSPLPDPRITVRSMILANPDAKLVWISPKADVSFNTPDKVLVIQTDPNVGLTLQDIRSITLFLEEDDYDEDYEVNG